MGICSRRFIYIIIYKLITGSIILTMEIENVQEAIKTVKKSIA